MPLPTLRLENVPVGSIRSAEMAVIDEAWAALARNASAPTATVVVEGPTGSGKSFLVETWYTKQVAVQERLPQPSSSMTVPLIRGKFNKVEGCYSRPYSAIAQMLVQLCQAVSDQAKLREVVLRRLGADVQALTYCIPRLTNLLYGTQGQCPQVKKDEDWEDMSERTMTEQSYSSSASNSDFQPNSGSFDRFSFLFCEFLQCICSILPRFILFIDDVQWGDENSLELLETIATDPDLTGILILLTSRPVVMPSLSNVKNLTRARSTRRLNLRESSSGSMEPLPPPVDDRFLTQLRKSLGGAGKELHYLQLGDLSMEQVNIIVSAATELSPGTTQPLSQIVFEKTGGNALFVVEFLESLQRRQLLRYSMVEYRWTWDEDEIQGQMDLADNVAAVVSERIKILPNETQRVLHLASWMGYSFLAEDMAYLVEGMKLLPEITCLCEGMATVEKIAPPSSAAIQSILQKAVDVALIDMQGDSTYKFAHDSIQQSFLSLTSEDNASPSFYLRVGSLLNGIFRQPKPYKCFSLFSSVKALNRGRVALKKECCQLTLAKLNLEVAERAYLMSSFFLALDHVNTGIEIVETTREPWKNHYELLLTLYRRAAVIGLTCGDHDRCQSAAKTVIQHGLSFQDMSSSYLALASSLRGQSKFNEAEATLMEALETLGEVFPKRFLRIQLSFINYERKRSLGRLSDEDIINLPKMSNRRDLKKMQFLGMLYINAYLQRNQTSLMVATRRMTAATFKLGLCTCSPLTFAAGALQMAKDRNFDDASRYAMLAHKIIEKVNSKDYVALVYFFLAAFVEHLKKPMSKAIPILEQGWQAGMETGDVESAFLCATTMITIRLLTAYPLAATAKLAEKYFRMARTYGQAKFTEECLANWQYAANLAGQTEDPLSFDGVIMQEEAMMQALVSADRRGRAYFLFLRAYAALFMGDLETAVRFFDEGIAVVGFLIVTTHYNITLMFIPACVAYYKLYARTKDSRLLSQGRRLESALRQLAAKGAINVASGLMFVEAQKAAIDQKLDDVKRRFDQASKALHLCGFQHWEALACENFAEFAFHHGDHDYASQYMKRAYELYLAWGAFAKTRQLRVSHSYLLKGLDSAALNRASELRSSKLTYESRLESSHRSSPQS